MSIQVRGEELEYIIKQRARKHGTTKSAAVRNLVKQAHDQDAFVERVLAQLQEAQSNFADRFFERLDATQRHFEERLFDRLAHDINAALQSNPILLDQRIKAVIDKQFEEFRGS